MEDEKDIQESVNPEEEETSKNDEEEKDWRKMYEDQKIRAEKAEKKLKQTKEAKPETSKKEEGETSKNEPNSLDDKAILNARALSKVADEDVDDFVKLSKRFGLSYSEAINNSDIKILLASRAEERKSASAANTGGGKRGSSKVSGDALLQKALKDGSIPDSDEELDRLLDARYKPNS